MEDFVDRLVEVKSTDDGLYRGLVVSIDPNKHELVLRNVKDMKTGEVRMNQYHFFKEQISDIKICEGDEKVVSVEQRKGKSDGEQCGPLNGVHVLSSQDVNYENDVLLMDASDEGPSLFQRQHIDPTLYLTDFEPPSSNVELVEPAQSMIIDDIGEKFEEAISKIKQQKVISFALEGRRIIRKGEISLVVIGTRPLVYIFDIGVIGPECMSNGLKSILEHKNILKVVFDIRMVSDCLSSLYKVYPMNVFDCQVADIFIHKRKYGQYPSEVSNLSDCLQRYLNIPRDQCSFESEKKKLPQRNSRIWIDRPFPDDFLEHCYKNVMFIRELRDPMIRQLLAEFLCGVDMYLDCVRSMPDHSAKYFNPRKLPKAIHSISAYKEKKNAKKNKKKTNEKTVLSDGSDVDAFEDNPWDTGINFNEKYQERHGEIVECIDYGPALIDFTKPILKSNRRAISSPENVADVRSPENLADTRSPENLVDTRTSENIAETDAPETTRETSSPSYFENEMKNGTDLSSDCELSSDVQNEMSDLCLSSANDTQSYFPDEQLQKVKAKSLSPNVFNNSNMPFRKSNSPMNTNMRKALIDETLYPDSCEETTKVFDEFQVSTSEFESDDSDIFLSSVNDPPQKGKSNYINNNAWPALPTPPHTISKAGKRMILAHILPPPPVDLKPRDQSFSPDLSEFPPLDASTVADNRKLTNSNRASPEEKQFGPRVELRQPTSQSFDEIRSKTPENMNGVKLPTAKPKMTGRGQTLQFLAQHSKKCAVSNLVSPRFLDEGKHLSYQFPSDEELLQLPQVTPMIENKPIRGELISVTKKFPLS